MSALLSLRQAVIDGIKAKLPPQWDVAGHLGRFAAADLNAFLLKAPAVRVAILGLTDSRRVDDDAIECRVRIGIFVIAKDRLVKLEREEIAAVAVETIVLLSLGQRWGLAFAKAAEPATAQLISSDETLAKGVALWAIDLPQPAVLARPEGETWPLTEIYLGLAPEIGPEHVADYIGPITATGTVTPDA